ncbi:MAG: carbonic anhydrase, partial [Cyanobacteriota bacterium erpe_2018_sw_39hr_WHONDRS-SW48-000098_B_bin.30]|nr:carbonic anhydrase [Cyanobacteriota bacterium erpe_2018_sw_39hr_WHONDRS-SW48-000098_B_bin.30]
MCSLLFGVPHGQNLTERLGLLAKVVVVNRAVEIGLPGLQLEVNRSIEMQKLITGVHDFQNRVFDKHRELFERLSQGQNPEALFITCSDSRCLVR